MGQLFRNGYRLARALTLCYTAPVYGYDDIHNNLRYWMDQLVTAVSRTADEVVIYDIGANDGELTVPFARDPHRIVAFEPGPVAQQRLIQRLREFGGDAAVERVTLYPLALGAQSSTATLHVYSDDTFSSLHHRRAEDLEQYALKPADTVTVAVETLDFLRQRDTLPPPHIVKIDVEGGERDVLRGAAGTLTTHRPALLMEYSCINTANAGYPREELLDLLRSSGYDQIYGLYRNSDRHPYTGSALDSCRIWNVLAVPGHMKPLIDQHDPREICPPE